MSFSDCMKSSGLPVPSVDGLNEAKEFIENLHQAWEAAGGEMEMTLAALLAVGAVTGIDEEAVAAVAAVTVSAYIGACIGCLAAAGIEALKGLFASNPPQDFMSQQLASLGFDLSTSDTAAA